MVATADSDSSQPLITWTATGANKLKECELVTRGLGIKLYLNGDNFTEWFELVSTHARAMSMYILFECSPGTATVSPVHEK